MSHIYIHNKPVGIFLAFFQNYFIGGCEKYCDVFQDFKYSITYISIYIFFKIGIS